MIDAKCKICRRAGEKLFLKGEKCFTPKCTFIKKPYAPGKLDSERKHKSVTSEFGTQLKEKQKVRNTYGVGEKQFHNYIKLATSTKGVNPTEKLYEDLESRIDNIIYRLSFAKSRSFARQVVSHGHILINGTKITIPSYKVRIGDVISVREGSKSTVIFTDLDKKLEKVNAPSWIEFDAKKLEAKITGKPKDKELIFNLNTVLEFYSR